MVAFVLCACSNELDDLFVSGPPDAGSMPSAEPEDEEPPWLPALPDDDNVAGCEACAKRECVQARHNCLEDDACTAQLGCMATCDDPGCTRECQAEHAGADWWSPWWEDLFVCVYGRCRAECKTGQNWGCSGKYDWPRAEASRIAVRVRFGGGLSGVRVGFGGQATADLSGARVRVCSFGGCQGGPFDEGMLDAANSAALELPAEWGSADFRGHFEVESEETGRFQTRYRLHPRPIAFPGELRFLFGDSGTAVQSGWRPSNESASLWVVVWDCTGNLGGELRLGLADQPQAPVLYLNSNSFLDLSAQATPLGIAFLPVVATPPDSLVTVRAVRADGDEEVARRTLPVRNGWMTEVELDPPARSDE